MGAHITNSESSSDGEPRGNIVIKGGELNATVIGGAEIPNVIDELPILAVAGALARGNTLIKDAQELRVKETDRIAAMITELSKIGVAIGTMPGDDGAIYVEPPKGGVDCTGDCPLVEFDTYDDHRMAMSLALVSLRRPNVVIKDPACVAKTYPTFWKDFARLHGAATEEHL